MLSQRTDIETHLLRRGFAVVHDFLSSNDVQTLLKECELLVEQARESDALRAEADPQWAATARGCVFESIGGQHEDGAAFHRLRRRAVPDTAAAAAAADLLFGDAIRQLVHATLGSPCFLFNDQYIVKPPGAPLSAFPWHRDSDWVADADIERHPYISVWCALDNMTAENGALVIRPEAAGATAADEPAEVVLEVAAGTAVVMTDSVWHRSTPNLSARTRAAWMPQFSAMPIRYRSTAQPVSMAVPMSEEN